MTEDPKPDTVTVTLRREECAKVAEAYRDQAISDDWAQKAHVIAAAIRARKDTK